MTFPYFQGQKVVRLSDDDYYFYLVNEIKKAQKRIYAVMFIIDPLKDPNGRIRKILEELSYAKWKGLDVKLVVGHSDKTFVIDVCDRAAKKYADSIGVPVKFANPGGRYSLHSKYVLLDDNRVILGSHNWTGIDIFYNNEDSVALYSKEIASNLGQEFNELWENGQEVLK